jgi:hypothetical protein
VSICWQHPQVDFRDRYVVRVPTPLGPTFGKLFIAENRDKAAWCGGFGIEVTSSRMFQIPDIGEAALRVCSDQILGDRVEEGSAAKVCYSPGCGW